MSAGYSDGQLAEIRRALAEIKAEGGGITARHSTRRLGVAIALYVAILTALVYLYPV